jgi:hypothetical protein
MGTVGVKSSGGIGRRAGSIVKLRNIFARRGTSRKSQLGCSSSMCSPTRLVTPLVQSSFEDDGWGASPGFPSFR